MAMTTEQVGEGVLGEPKAVMHAKTVSALTLPVVVIQFLPDPIDQVLDARRQRIPWFRDAAALVGLQRVSRWPTHLMFGSASFWSSRAEFSAVPETDGISPSLTMRAPHMAGQDPTRAVERYARTT